jgi:hypothetical protein
MRVVMPYDHLLSSHGSIDEAAAYYSFRGGRLSGVDPKARLVAFEFAIPCDKLDAENRCALHETPEKKPVLCHRYPTGPDDIPTCGYYWT